MKLSQKTNVVLIGMPAAGKSTIGILCAKQLGLQFIDTDVMIQTLQKRSLQDIMDHEGLEAFRRIESQALLQVRRTKHVIATGGSAIYYEDAMKHLSAHGIVVFLEVTLEVLKKRLSNFGTRGIARSAGQTLEELFNERQVLYRRYGEITIDCTTLTHEEVCAAVCTHIEVMRGKHE
ncbi:MAG: shikimate kinase [Chitinivibrionales bacterium]|nr:shikimate kinase [Chitinivibrionales bacterium]